MCFLDGCRGRCGVSVVGGFELHWRDVAAPGVEPVAVVPVDPFEDFELDVLEGSPGSEAVDDLGLEEPVERLGGGVVVGLTG